MRLRQARKIVKNTRAKSRVKYSERQCRIARKTAGSRDRFKFVEYSMLGYPSYGSKWPSFRGFDWGVCPDKSAVTFVELKPQNSFTITNEMLVDEVRQTDFSDFARLYCEQWIKTAADLLLGEVRSVPLGAVAETDIDAHTAAGSQSCYEEFVKLDELKTKADEKFDSATFGRFADLMKDSRPIDRFLFLRPAYDRVVRELSQMPFRTPLDDVMPTSTLHGILVEVFETEDELYRRESELLESGKHGFRSIRAIKEASDGT